MTIEQEYLEKYINLRIKKLFEQANGQFYISPGNQTPRFVFEHNHMLDFVDLIVRECAEITDGLSKLYPRTDVAFDVGYTMGTSRATKEIKQHFGVEE